MRKKTVGTGTGTRNAKAGSRLASTELAVRRFDETLLNFGGSRGGIDPNPISARISMNTSTSRSRRSSGM